MLKEGTSASGCIWNSLKNFEMQEIANAGMFEELHSPVLQQLID